MDPTPGDDRFRENRFSVPMMGVASGRAGGPVKSVPSINGNVRLQLGYREQP